jgi:hypothetical protein
LKCFKGELKVTKNTTREQKEKEPELKECHEYDDVCVSTNVRTDWTIIDGPEQTYLAGSWTQ